MSREHGYLDAPPRRLMRGVAVIRDAEDSVLIVRNRYAATMRLPGASAEGAESVDLACARGIRDDVGLTVNCRNVIAVDYAPVTASASEVYCLVFDGGKIEDQKPAIILGPDLGHYEWSPVEDFHKHLTQSYERRLRRALDQNGNGGVLFLWRGDAPSADDHNAPAFSSTRA